LEGGKSIFGKAALMLENISDRHHRFSVFEQIKAVEYSRILLLTIFD
jgi:hypothetical protein